MLNEFHTKTNNKRNKVILSLKQLYIRIMRINLNTYFISHGLLCRLTIKYFHRYYYTCYENKEKQTFYVKGKVKGLDI